MSSYNNNNNTLTKFGSNIRVLNTPMEQYVTEGELVERLATKQDILQYDVLPTASAENLGKIVQYIGETTTDYVSGSFYKCVANSSVYSWELTSVTRAEFENVASEVVEEKQAYRLIDYTLIKKQFLKRQIRGLSVYGQAASAIIPVNAGETYRITGCYFSDACLYGFMDANDEYTLLYPAEDPGSTLIKETVTITIPDGVVKMTVSSINCSIHPPLIKMYKDYISVKGEIGNPLFGKKWTVCGDSFTDGDFLYYTDAQGNTGFDSDAWAEDGKCWKTYHYYIGKRNDMDIQKLAIGYACMSNVEGNRYPFSNPNTPESNYTQIDTDSDYVTIMFGLNETKLTDEQIGTKTDNNNTTFWGSFNLVIRNILTNNPTVKIGIIIEDGWLPQKIHDTLIDISKWWGIPYLDLRNDPSVPVMNGGRLDPPVNPEVDEIRKSIFFRNGTTDKHPTPKAHEYRSTVIENFLRSL